MNLNVYPVRGVIGCIIPDVRSVGNVASVVSPGLIFRDLGTGKTWSGMGRSNNGVWQWVTMVTDKQVVAIQGQYRGFQSE